MCPRVLLSHRQCDRVGGGVQRRQFLHRRRRSLAALLGCRVLVWPGRCLPDGRCVCGGILWDFGVRLDVSQLGMRRHLLVRAGVFLRRGILIVRRHDVPRR
jgi:hypothetical protein